MGYRWNGFGTAAAPSSGACPAWAFAVTTRAARQATLYKGRDTISDADSTAFVERGYRPPTWIRFALRR